MEEVDASNAQVRQDGDYEGLTRVNNLTKFSIPLCNLQNILIVTIPMHY
jgi:hypothetical protein